MAYRNIDPTAGGFGSDWGMYGGAGSNYSGGGDEIWNDLCNFGGSTASRAAAAFAKQEKINSFNATLEGTGLQIGDDESWQDSRDPAPQSGGNPDPQSGGSKTPNDFITVTGEMFINGKGVAAANYSTKDNKGKLVVGVDKFGAIIYDIGEDLSKSNPKIAPEGVVAIDESRWDKESIFPIPRFIVIAGMRYALTPMIGESTAEYAIQKFKDGNGKASFMGSTSTYYDGARYNVLNFRVQFDLVIQRVKTSIWIDISAFHKLDQRP